LLLSQLALVVMVDQESMGLLLMLDLVDLVAV
jgi:hypothetical protein